MSDAPDIILKFDIVDGRSPRAESVLAALSSWIELTKTAGVVLEPEMSLEIHLVGVEEGSQIFKFAFRRAQQIGNEIIVQLEELPQVTKAALKIASLIGGTALTVAVTNILTDDPRIPEDQMQIFADMKEKLVESNELQRETMRFYGVLQGEPAYTQLSVSGPRSDDPSYVIPRSEFAARSGLWTQTETVPTSESHVVTSEWDVILIKPVLRPVPRRWRFVREGIEFSATMNDEAVLEALHNRTLPLKIAEGETMRVEIQYKETFDGKVWVPVQYSHKIKRVISPRIRPIGETPLFSPTLAKN